MIATPPLPPPAIEQPAPYRVSYGGVTGVAAPGTRRVLVRVGGRTLADLPLRGRRFHVRADLPVGETTVTVVTVDARRRRASTSVPHVFGAPRAARPQLRATRVDPALQRALRRLAARFPGTSGLYVESLTTGAGGAWNARAAFPAASTLKLAIAVTALSRTNGTPPRGSMLDELLRQMLIVSDNAAANAVERSFGGSTSGGSALVNAMMRSLGLVDTEMYGGYELDPYAFEERATAGPIPLRVDSQPRWGVGKRTTAWDLGSLAKGVWLASGGLGALRRAQPGFTGEDARYLLYLLARVRDTGKLDRELRGLRGVSVLHKAGWVGAARHDNGIVFWSGGAFVATVMTHRPSGAGPLSDALAGRVARSALDRFRG